MLPQELSKAASSSSVVQFSFLTSSGFRGVPASKGTHPVQNADCWDEQGRRHRSSYGRFATVVNAVSVFTPVSGAVVTAKREKLSTKLTIMVHVFYSEQALLEGMYFQSGCVRSLPEACFAGTALEFAWDFELLRPVDKGRCITPRCESIFVAAAADTELAAGRACRSYHQNLHSNRMLVRSATRLGARLLQSELVHTCTERLRLALASFLGCNGTGIIDWGAERLEVLTAELAISSSVVWTGRTPYVRLR